MLFNEVLYWFSQIMQVFVFVIGCYLFSISIFGFVAKLKQSEEKFLPRKSFALVIAAHNEEIVIDRIIESLKKQNYPSELYDIFVVADNCTDDTAQVAREHGAVVYERKDDINRGKGYALEWMFEKIFQMENQYDAVSVFDADNLVSSDYLLEMNNKLCQGHSVVQGYLDSKNPFDSWITCSYSIAFWLSNYLFQLPRYFLGLSCGLCGTGFCITLDVLKEIGWGATCLTEDLEFTMKLALNNMKVAWAHKAVVYDEKPITLRQSWNQRRRWMQGHADCISRFTKPLVSKAFKEGDLIAFDCGVYLFQPIRFLFIGLLTLMMWIQSIYPYAPFFSLKNIFPLEVWYVFATLQFFYGPFVVLIAKKLNFRVFIGFLIYPFYCLTWVPITIQGFLKKNEKVWSHTLHTRKISITDLEEKLRKTS